MLKFIKTEKDHEDAVARIYDLMQLDIVPGSAISDELEGSSILVEAYD